MSARGTRRPGGRSTRGGAAGGSNSGNSGGSSIGGKGTKDGCLAVAVTVVAAATAVTLALLP